MKMMCRICDYARRIFKFFWCRIRRPYL